MALSMSSFSDLFKEGWSTSKPGDMKNAMGTPQMFAKTSPALAPTTPSKPAGVFTTASAARERDFLSAVNAKAEAEKARQDSLLESVKTKAISSLMPNPALVRDAQMRNAEHQRAVEAAAKPNPDRPQTNVDAW